MAPWVGAIGMGGGHVTLSQTETRVQMSSRHMDMEDEEETLARCTVADSVNAHYEYEFSLFNGYDYDEVKPIGVTVKHDGCKIGSGHGRLIDRSTGGFHELCDSVSQEMWDMGSSFASDDGRLVPGIDGLTTAQYANASRGNFVHIELVVLDAEHRGADLGLRCLHGLLAWLSTIRPWTFAVLFPAPDPGSIPPDSVHGSPALKAVALKIRRQWLRLGFARKSSTSPYFYLLPSRLALGPKIQGPTPRVLGNFDLVSVGGLTSEKGKALNGKVGTVVMYHGDKQRYEVDVRGETGTTAFKVENLTFCEEPEAAPAPP